MANNTKAELAVALKKLMETRPLDKITVKDIVKECGVNRQTFYYHFRDIYDLLDWIFQTEACDSIAALQNYETWQDGFREIMQYIWNNKDFCINAFRSLGREQLDFFLNNVVYALLSSVIDELSQDCRIKEEDKNFIARFFTFGITGMLADWLRSGLAKNPETVVQEISTIMEGQLSMAINRYKY